MPIWTALAPSISAAAMPRAVADPAGGDHRQAGRVGDLAAPERTAPSAPRTARSRKRPAWPPASQPWAMIASTPRAASQRASADVVALPMIRAPAANTRFSKRLFGQAEMEADQLGPDLLDHSAHRRVERPPQRRARARADRRRLDRNRARAAPARRRRRRASAIVWQKKLRLSGPAACAAHLGDLRSRLRPARASRRAASRPRRRRSRRPPARRRRRRPSARR